MFPPDPSIKCEKHCLIYCGDDRCDCSANPTLPSHPFYDVTRALANPIPDTEERKL